MDVSRYGDWATLAYTNAKVRENYSRRFRIRFPNEELIAARPLAHDAGVRSPPGSVTRCLATIADSSIRCGSRPSAREATEDITFRRSNAHSTRGGRMQSGARGRRSARNLELRQIRGHRPRGRAMAVARDGQPVPEVGRIALTPMLNERGKLIGDFTMCRVGSSASFSSAPTQPRAITCGGSSERCLRQAFRSAPVCDGVRRSVGRRTARALLQSLVRDDLSNAAFPFMSFRRMEVGHDPGLRGPRLLHGRPRLRNLGDDGVSARAL